MREVPKAAPLAPQLSGGNQARSNSGIMHAAQPSTVGPHKDSANPQVHRVQTVRLRNHGGRMEAGEKTL